MRTLNVLGWDAEMVRLAEQRLPDTKIVVFVPSHELSPVCDSEWRKIQEIPAEIRYASWDSVLLDERRINLRLAGYPDESMFCAGIRHLAEDYYPPRHES